MYICMWCICFVIYLEMHGSKPHGHKGEEEAIQNGNVLYGEGRADLEID